MNILIVRRKDDGRPGYNTNKFQQHWAHLILCEEEDGMFTVVKDRLTPVLSAEVHDARTEKLPNPPKELAEEIMEKKFEQKIYTDRDLAEMNFEQLRVIANHLGGDVVGKGYPELRNIIKTRQSQA